MEKSFNKQRQQTRASNGLKKQAISARGSAALGVNTTMMFGFLSLVLPTLCLAVVHLKKCGLSYSREFRGWGAFKAVGLASMLFHLLLLVALGASFFCGFCFYRTQSFAFLSPGIGYALMAFPGVVGEIALSNFEERHAAIIVYIAGAVFALYGLFMASYYA